jgi:hypothetical protein
MVAARLANIPAGAFHGNQHVVAANLPPPTGASDLPFDDDAYERAIDASDTKTSWRVFGDSKKVGALRSGADIQVKRAEAAFHWFSDNWPGAAEWPEGVNRPERSAAAHESAAPASEASAA